MGKIGVKKLCAAIAALQVFSVASAAVVLLPPSIIPAHYNMAGEVAGLAYYYFVGCASGSCRLTSSPYITMAYPGVIGGLLSVVFGKERDKCNM